MLKLGRIQLCSTDAEHPALTQGALSVGWHLNLKIEYNDNDLKYVSSTSMSLSTETSKIKSFSQVIKMNQVKKKNHNEGTAELVKLLAMKLLNYKS